MSAEVERLHMFFFPLMAHGHMLPMVDMSLSFAKHGVLVTIITTPFSASLLQKTIDRALSAGYHLRVHLIKLPYAEAGLPDGVEHTDQITSHDMFMRFLKAINMVQQPFERLIQEHRPSCLVSDGFLPWTVDSAAKFGIPTLFFIGTSCFASSARFSVARHNPHQHLESDTQIFVLPGLPHRIEMTRLQLPDSLRVRNHSSEFWESKREAERRSCGILANSFRELEREYVEFLSKEVGKKVWPIGPVSLSGQKIVDKVHRGKKADIDEDECLRWLDSMNPSSVVYVSFGSAFSHGNRQLLEIASALEASSHPFIWVVNNYESLSNEPWLPNGFEERMAGKGLIIKGWAPQILILNHPSLGAMVTHCGWNSAIEGISAGLPMITWPIFAEQFFNEKLITVVLKIGVGVGVTECVNWKHGSRTLVKRNDIEMVIRQVMDGGEEAEEIRKRGRQLSEMAKNALEEGGSSYLAMTALIDELKKISGLN